MEHFIQKVSRKSPRRVIIDLARLNTSLIVHACEARDSAAG